MRLDRLAGARVGLLGFGREGRAFEHAVISRGVEMDVTVLAEHPPELKPRGWPLALGPLEDRQADFDVLVRSPGIPVDHTLLANFRERGGRVVSPSSIWFSERPEARVIAVTGSKGKSTTAALIAHLLSGAGMETVLAGNIGVPLLAHLDTRADWFVAELSSYQLADLSGKPELGVITRLFPEHTSWHGGAQRYFAAKLRLLDLLDGGRLVVNGADPELEKTTARAANRLIANRQPAPEAGKEGIYRAGVKLLDAGDLALIGRHNLDNLAVALAVAMEVGVALEPLLASARSFIPLAHRLEPVPGPDRIRWINDSIATTPYATRAALEAFAGHAVVLVAGGQERGGDWEPVVEFCAGRPLSGLVTLPDNGPGVAGKLIAAGAVAAERVRSTQDMDQAVAAARGLVPPNGIVLLSPGAPSFPHFRDFEDRGNRFRQRVQVL